MSETTKEQSLIIENEKISYQEFMEIARNLEICHAVFYQLWQLGKPCFTKDIPTAAVRFDKAGECIEFLFNPEFWKSLDIKQRAFIISHECLHVILKHGIRMQDSEHKEACNVAMDVVINELLLNQFGFMRKDIDPEGKYCWLDTIFVDPQTQVLLPNIDREESFEYYYNRLPSNFKKPANRILVDIHDFINGEESYYAIDKLNDSLTNEEKESIKNIIKKLSEENNGQQAGTGTGGQWRFMSKKQEVKKKKWETVIKKWSHKFLRNDFDFFEHWARVNRRIIQLPQDLIMPCEMELQDKEEDGKIVVYFFLDTSGSCSSLAGRFWKAAKTLPPHRFNKRLFCFDTKVYEVDEKVGKLYGFGGTSFSILEKEINRRMQVGTNTELKKYPHAVFVITDGYGDRIQPAYPKRWHWFLTSNGYLGYIPKECNIYNLKDFE